MYEYISINPLSLNSIYKKSNILIEEHPDVDLETNGGDIFVKVLINKQRTRQQNPVSLREQITRFKII